MMVSSEGTATGFWNRHFLLKEFIRDQVPMILGIFILGVVASYIQNGFLPGTDRPFRVAGVRVAIWHLVWMGFWSGYLMGLVGEASGIISLPYTMTVLQFDSVAVSPTSLITTFVNQFGALFGYWRGNQWNFDFARWLCFGAVLGSPIGPLIRVYWLQDPQPFKMTIGLALVVMAVHLWVQITPWYMKRAERQRVFKEKFDHMMQTSTEAGEAPTGLPVNFKILTVEKSWKTVRIEYWGEQQSFSVPVMFFIGFVVGIVAAALGVGGGFMLVPIMATLFGVPLYVLVAATIPFVITLSITGLISYIFTMHLLVGKSTAPDWGFGLFVASGAILGAWVASKTQKFIPERYLKPMLGTITGLIGVLYVINYFWSLPFRI